LLTGFYVAAAMGDRVPADPHTALAAHLTGLLGAFWMFGAGWTMPMLRYGPVGQARLAWAIIIPNYAGWLITGVKALPHVHGVEPGGGSANNAVFIALTLLVVLPALGAGVAWLAGFRQAKA
jgi:hydroxylaminobenzene mutase